MALTTPALAFPVRFRAGRFLAVEQGSDRHLEDRAEVLLRTRRGSLDATPDLGIRELVGTLGPVAPEVLGALAREVSERFAVAEGLPTRVRDVAVALHAEAQED